MKEKRDDFSEKIVEEEINNEEDTLIRHGNVSLVLDSYDDIFSDFDPRPYEEKAISDDFLVECNRAVRDKSDLGLELRLLLPKKKRNLKDEIKIRSRLRNHFHKHSIEKEKIIKKIKREGIIWIIVGAILMGLVTSLRTYTEPTLLINMVIIIAEPAGWFGFWEGLLKVLMDSREKQPEYEFYKKMSKAKIIFQDY